MISIITGFAWLIVLYNLDNDAASLDSQKLDSGDLHLHSILVKYIYKYAFLFFSLTFQNYGDTINTLAHNFQDLTASHRMVLKILILKDIY